MIPIRTKHIRLRLDPGSYETLLQLNDSELNLITLCGSTMPTKAPVVTAPVVPRKFRREAAASY